MSDTEKTLKPTTLTTDKAMHRAISAEKTLQGDASKTLRPNNQDEIGKIVHQIEQQAEQNDFLLQSINYNSVRVVSEGSTGEADIYLVENGTKQFALKIYKPDIKPDKDIIEIVCQNSGNPALSFLVDTLHHGYWTNPNTGQPHYYELMAYCTGGSLDQMTITHDAEGERLLGEIAIRSAACIDFLHSKQVIHRDIKPANFFFRKEGNNIDELSLADFGIAIRCDENSEAKVKIQMRTKIYAAPEYYVTIDGITITKSLDFYSLGMMLLVLWEGGEERFRAPGERILWTLKQDNKLPYPQDMSPRLLQLVKALTIADPERRAGFKEVAKWAKGEEVHDEESIPFNIIYNASRKQIARSREELVKFMLEDQKLATTYLYRGQISAWLKEMHYSELSTPIDEIIEIQFPKNKEAGFWTACYFLDPDLKYVDVNNRAIEENEEIAASLKDNFDYYSRALTDENNKLFIYLNATGRRRVNKFIPLFERGKDNRDAMLQLIYAFDPTLPWTITAGKGETIECQTIDDVIHTIYKVFADPDFQISQQSDDDLVSESFLIWIGTRNKVLEGKIRSVQGHDENIWAILYNLNPKISYEFVLDKNSDEYFFTATEIGHYMNLQLDEYIRNEDDNSYASRQLDMVLDIDDTRMYHYFKSKGGIYDDKIDWIKYCVDVDSKDNTHKAGPYNWKIGIYKAIAGLGYEPFYYFGKSDKYVFSLDQLDKIPKKEIKEELEKGYLEAWLTIFFQENPKLNLSPQYAYEEATDRFMQQLELLDKNHENVVDYRTATNYLKGILYDLKRKYRYNRLSKTIVGTLTFIATAAVIYSLLSLDIPTERDIHSGWILIVAVAVGIIVTVYTIYDINSDLGCMGILLIGAFFAVITYFGLLFLAPYLVYLASALLVTMLVRMIIRMVKSSVSKGRNRDLFDPSTEELIVEPLHFAFRAKAGENFKSSIGNRIANLTKDIGENTKTFYQKLIVPWISILILGTIAFGSNLLEETIVSEALATKQKYASLEGEWKGTFDQQDAVMSITKANEKEVEANIMVTYKQLTIESVRGTINMETRIFHFDDIHNNGNLDGEYNGKFNDDFTKFSGIYQNYRTKKQVDFIFTR